MTSPNRSPEVPQGIVNHGKAIVQERINIPAQRRVPPDVHLLIASVQVDAALQVDAFRLQIVHTTCKQTHIGCSTLLESALQRSHACLVKMPVHYEQPTVCVYNGVRKDLQRHGRGPGRIHA